MNTHAIYVKAPNDRNGNPRRGWIFTESSGETWWQEEGYAGLSAIKPDIRAEYLRQVARDAITINVTAGEYRSLRKQWSQ